MNLPPINLLAWQSPTRYRRNRRYSQFFVIALILALSTSLGALSYLHHQQHHLQQRIVLQQQQLHRYTPLLTRFAWLQTHLASAAADQQRLQAIANQQQHLACLWLSAVKHLTTAISWQSARFTPTSIHLQVQAVDESALQTWLTPWLADAHLRLVQQQDSAANQLGETQIELTLASLSS